MQRKGPHYSSALSRLSMTSPRSSFNQILFCTELLYNLTTCPQTSCSANPLFRPLDQVSVAFYTQPAEPSPPASAEWPKETLGHPGLGAQPKGRFCAPEAFSGITARCHILTLTYFDDTGTPLANASKPTRISTFVRRRWRNFNS